MKEFASSMERRSSVAAKKDVQIKLRREEFVLSMERRSISSVAATKVAIHI
jgi:hypothetical protein